MIIIITSITITRSMDGRLSMGLHVTLLGLMDFWINKENCRLLLPTCLSHVTQECIIKFVRLVIQKESLLGSLGMNLMSWQ